MKRLRQSGVSLVEALVALAVMAFGMLGLVGMLATMRSNGDLSKQRSEAVRIGQEQIERMRTYAAMTQFTAIGSQSDVAVTSLDVTNATYSWTSTITDAPTTLANTPPIKDVVLDVQWQDRAGIDQRVELTTKIVGVAPIISAAMSTSAAGKPVWRPSKRSPVIPQQAVDQGNGTSRFTPPGLSAGWVFSNDTGVIVKVCDVTFTVCTNTNLLLMSGYVRFAYSAAPPTSADSENPVNDTALTVGVAVDETYPSTTTVVCASGVFGSYVSYFCALPISTASPYVWSGRSYLGGTDLPLASSATDPAVDRYRVCRYTPQHATGNDAHPATYTSVASGLINQNFLVIRAGNGTSAYACPGDDTSTPDIDGTTVAHQP